jgi:hypothetical protein
VLYAMDLLALGISLWALGGRAASTSDRFVYGYALAVPLIVLMWPTAWIHYQTLLILPFAMLLGRQLLLGRRAWWAWLPLILAFLLVAIGNEYTVLVPALQEGPARLLQSYKLYGVLILWGLHIWLARRGYPDESHPPGGFEGPIREHQA